MFTFPARRRGHAIAGLLVLAATACARPDAPAVSSLDCARLTRDILHARAEQNDGTVDKIAEMYRDLATALLRPERWNDGPLAYEDPIRLGEMEQRHAALTCPQSLDTPE